MASSNPKTFSAETGLSRRVFLGLSAMLNLALLAALGVFARAYFKPAVAPEQTRIVTNVIVQTLPELPPADPLTNAPATNTPSIWSQIETNDLDAFAANLRNVGCPERTIRDILLPRLDQLFERKSSVIYDVPNHFWRTASQREIESINRRHYNAELLNQHAEMARRLFGFEYIKKALESWHKENELAWIIGFMDEEKCERFCCRGQRFGMAYEELDASRFSITTEQDLENRKNFYHHAREEMARDLSPAEAEEVELRILTIVTFIFRDQKIKESKVTGAELRQILAMERKLFDPLGALILKDDDEQGEQIEQAFKKQLLPQVEAFLGPIRFHDFLRANDNNFSNICDAMEKLKVPLETADKLFQIKSLADDEGYAIQHTEGISRRERKARLKEIQQQTQDAIVQLLGADTARRYGETPNNWVKEIVK